MAARTHHVVVAGTGGGVGTTTVASLLFASLADRAQGAPELLDHSDGELGLRLPEGDDAARIDPEYAVHDLGAHASGEGTELLASPIVLLVIVAPATSGGVASASLLLETIRDRHGANGTSRSLVALVGVFGRHRIGANTEGLRERFGRDIVVVLPQDAALAAGGRVPLARLSADTITASASIARLVGERLALRRRM